MGFKHKIFRFSIIKIVLHSVFDASHFVLLWNLRIVCDNKGIQLHQINIVFPVGLHFHLQGYILADNPSKHFICSCQHQHALHFQD